jgi:tRNA threonylcarbamoyl adenosine modification protein YeaZ
MNRVLGFDVSNHSCSAAISIGDNILSYEEEVRPSMQAERILQIIESVLKNANLNYRDIEYLALTNGPGSFTGIRIGLAVAKGILYCCDNIKGLTITNFDMSYYRSLTQVKSFDKVFVILNAYRGQVYLQEFNQLGPSSKPQLLDIESVYSILEKSGANVVCVGSGLICVHDQIKNLDNITLLPRFKVIKAVHICRYAHEKIKPNLFGPIEPLYIRVPDAKIITNL